MTKKLIVFLIYCCINSSTSAQTVAWANGIGAAPPDGNIFAEGITVDYIGNVINTGTFYDSYDFDPGPGILVAQSPQFTASVFIQKLNPVGNLLWVKTIGAPFQFIAMANCVTEVNGEIVITGTFEGTVDFDPGVGVENHTASSRDIFIVKLTASGNLLWAKTMGGNDWTYASALTINDGYLIGGAFSGTIDFDPDTNVTNAITALNADGFILKLTNNGSFTWVKQFISTGNAQVFSIKTDAGNNIIFGGNFGGRTDFDPGPGVDTLSSLNPSPPFYPVDCFIGKLTNAGIFVWANVYGGTNEEYVRELVITSTGDIIINGTFNQTTDFDPSAGVFNLTAALTDIYFLKLNSAGNFVWAKSVAGTFFAEVSRLVIDNDDYVYCTGSFEDTVDFDLGAGVNTFITADAEIFVLKVDTTGNTADIDILVGPDYEKGVAIAVDNNANIYCNGYYENTMDFDPQFSVYNLATQNNYKWMYTFNWKRCLTSTSNIINATGCTFTYNGQVYSGDGTYIQLLQNASGCDSVITINLTQSTTNTDIDTLSCSGSYTLNGQTYTTSGLYTQLNTNIAGCDSNFYLNLAVGLSNTSSYSATACDYYATNQSFYNTSGNYTEIYTNASGCDSTVTLNLTVNFSQNSTLTFAACDSFTFNGNTYTSSGWVSVLYTGANGCDSIINLDLTITNADTSITVGVNQLTANALSPVVYQWVSCPGFVPLIGDTSQTFIPTISGSYAVILTQNNCNDTSACYPVVVSGVVENNTLFKGIKIAPNPVNEFIGIEFVKPMENFNVNITTVTGQLLNSQKYFSTQKVRINVKDLSQGLYFLTIISEGNNIIHKIIKN